MRLLSQLKYIDLYYLMLFQLSEIINEVKIQFSNIDYDLYFNNMDAVSEFIAEYVKNKIIEIKHRSDEQI